MSSKSKRSHNAEAAESQQENVVASGADESLSVSKKAGWLADLAWIPWAVLALVFVLRFQVDIPTIDQWEGELPFLQKVAEGRATLSDLVAQQVEHRIGFSRAVSLMVAVLSGWNSRFYSLVTWVLMCVLATALCLLNRKTAGASVAQRFVTNFVGGSILFGLAQYDLWINAMMSSWVGIQLMLLAGVYVAISRWAVPLRFLVCGCIAFVATFSSSMGMQLWILLLPLLIVFGEPDKKWSRPAWVGGWIVVAAVAILLYFWGYQKPPEANATSLVKMLLFSVAAQGSVFAYGTVLSAVAVALALGFVVLVLYGACIGSVYLFWSDRDFVKRSLPWICLASFGVISCLAIALGRSANPLEVALASRYLTAPAFTVYALFAVFPIVLRWLTTPSASASHSPAGVPQPQPGLAARIPVLGWTVPCIPPRVSGMINASLVTAACLAHIVFSVRSVTSFENENIRYTAGKAAVLFSRHFFDGELLSNVWFQRLMPKYREMIDFMDKQDYLRPNTFQSARIYDLPKVYDNRSPQSVPAGAIEQVGNVGEGAVGFGGWAVLPGSNRPADVVLLSRGKGEDAVVFGIVPVGGRRPEIELKMGLETYKGCGWARAFPKDVLPSEETQIRAWAFDVDTGTAYELTGGIDWKPN